jgi:nucleoside-diphosphate-sugar epimerase
MPRIAIIGANGQVGAELCLMLAQRPEVSLVPICRNRSGSAFLRWHGIACRHGRIAHANDAARLIRDCEIVLNCALATGTPADIRRTEDAIAANMVAHSGPNAVLIHLSTQSVYGDPREARVRRRNPYGRAKLGTELFLQRAARRAGKPAYILRLGHVCGTLQEISHTIRAQIRSATAALPARDRSSNTVYTAAIVGAVLQIAAGDASAGVYDLMNEPRWTWREVYDYEAARMGIACTPRCVPEATHPRALRLKPMLRAVMRRLAGNQGRREQLAKLFARLPSRLNLRAMAWWNCRRAANEIAGLAEHVSIAEHLSWRENGSHFFPARVRTRQLLDELHSAPESPNKTHPWAKDLADAALAEARQPP